MWASEEIDMSLPGEVRVKVGYTFDSGLKGNTCAFLQLSFNPMLITL